MTVPTLIVATISLVIGFVTKDFEIEYVYAHSSQAMEPIYTWVAFYAGNEGSLLFIALMLSVMSAIAMLCSPRSIDNIRPYVISVLMSIQLFFLAVIILLANPFTKMLFIPEDGQGINPLLIHFGMFIHPPMQMTGLISVAIPFSVAIGAMLSGRVGWDEWVDLGRLWAMVSWVLLTIGLILGGWWAYTILGWGGYWAWDPVENSALMPWLAMTAFVHSIMVQKHRGMFRMWNMVLIIVAFSFAEMGMFINRGGPVPSVHSFAQSSMGWVFLAFMGFTLLGSLAVFVFRLGTLGSREKLDSLLSRESVFLLQNVLFLAVAFVTLWGTIYPVISDVFQGVIVTVAEPFFNKVNGPILLGIVFLMGVGPLLPWRRATPSRVISVLKFPLLGFLIVVMILLAIGINDLLPLLALGICSMSVTGIVHEWIRGIVARHKKGEIYPVAFARLFLGNRPRYGGYLVHLSIVMMSVGVIGSSFYDLQRDFVFLLALADAYEQVSV